MFRMDSISPCLDTWRLAKLTEGFSGSDLRELCRQAAVCRVYELEADTQDTLRPITMEDLLKALAKMRESKIECGEVDFRPPNLD
jgi:SpoVK/Ycf46/Vps4 family AAA+-type ATPase